MKFLTLDIPVKIKVFLFIGQTNVENKKEGNSVFNRESLTAYLPPIHFLDFPRNSRG
jgi:hypothetical protein